jgi:hypothetical protein
VFGAGNAAKPELFFVLQQLHPRTTYEPCYRSGTVCLTVKWLCPQRGI